MGMLVLWSEDRWDVLEAFLDVVVAVAEDGRLSPARTLSSSSEVEPFCREATPLPRLSSELLVVLSFSSWARSFEWFWPSICIEWERESGAGKSGARQPGSPGGPGRPGAAGGASGGCRARGLSPLAAPFGRSGSCSTAPASRGPSTSPRRPSRATWPKSSRTRCTNSRERCSTATP